MVSVTYILLLKRLSNNFIEFRTALKVKIKYNWKAKYKNEVRMPSRNK